jgi:hypothetical protein
MKNLYSPILSKEQLDKKFSNLRKLKYNQFRWWRMYDNPKPPLHHKQSLRDRILNGDFEYSHYKYQAEWCEHEINQIWGECYPDIGKFNEMSSLLRTRRKRLLEDFEKDENNKLSELMSLFTKHCKLSIEEVEEEMLKSRGSLIDFYYIIKDKYKTNKL